MRGALRALGRRVLPLSVRRWLSRAATRASRIPPVGAVRFGSLRRVTPISKDWGFDRGEPVDRHYVHAFLAAHSERIRGRVLEIDTNELTMRFGGEQVTQSDVLHIAERLPGVTLVGDLTDGDHLPSDTFDCVILTQTLQLIYDPRAALTTVYRMLTPGGTVLATVPGISRMTGDPEGRWGYFWGFTSLSAQRLFTEVFQGGEVEVETHGNVLAASAFLYGLASRELRAEELDHRDPDIELLITVRATRGGG